MNVAGIAPDLSTGLPALAPIPPVAAPAADVELFSGLTAAFSAAGTSLQRAQSAETAFTSGSGGLQEMVFERARADAILNVASATATKATQSLNTILNMQV